MSKVVVITGAGRKLGKAFAIGLSRYGYQVVAAATEQAELDSVAQRLEGDYMVKLCDITGIEDCRMLIAEIMEKYGRLDVLINNAGIYVGDSFVDTPADRLKAVMDVVVTGTAVISREALTVMSKQHSGQIVSVLDARVRSGLPEYDKDKLHSVDVSAKIAKARLTDILRREAANHGVAVTSFYMHWVASEIDIDDEAAAPKGATHPRDAVELMHRVIENGTEEVDLPPSSR